MKSTRLEEKSEKSVFRWERAWRLFRRSDYRLGDLCLFVEVEIIPGRGFKCMYGAVSEVLKV